MAGKTAALIIGMGKPAKKDDAKPMDDLESCMGDLISAVKAGDSDGAAAAFRACFTACESEPHAEADEE